LLNVRLLKVRLAPSGLSFEAGEDETLLAAALRAGVALPNSCRNGTCRTCRCTVARGEVVHTIEWPGLSREERAEGWVLPCVAVARTDVVLAAPDAKLVIQTPAA
jgi:ferredoxin